jgi:hypothetical protein
MTHEQASRYLQFLRWRFANRTREDLERLNTALKRASEVPVRLGGRLKPGDELKREMADLEVRQHEFKEWVAKHGND